MPNDPSSRLEAQEQLAVLMEELENMRQLQVPFLGLDIKREKKTRKMRREEMVRLTLIEEAGWMHLAHDRRDFVFVEGENSGLCFCSSWMGNGDHG